MGYILNHNNEFIRDGDKKHKKKDKKKFKHLQKIRKTSKRRNRP